VLKRILLGLVVLLVVMQFIPVSRTNPPVTREVHWNAPATRDLARRACFNCHSNETSWPVWARIAPTSFLIAHDVNEGRGEMNFSTWDQPQRARPEEVTTEIRDGDMPPWYYVPMHPEAKLSDAEKMQLIDGLRATFAQDPPTRPARRR
jgi:cytochrome c551/c552